MSSHRCMRCYSKGGYHVDNFVFKLFPFLEAQFILQSFSSKPRICKKCSNEILKWNTTYRDNDDDVIIAY